MSLRLIHVKDLSQAIYVAGLKKEAAAQTFNLTDGFTRGKIQAIANPDRCTAHTVENYRFLEISCM
jgi:hypothetical protein